MINYVAGSNKGQTEQGDLFNNPFQLGGVDKNYTNEKVVETVADASAAYTLAWDKSVKGAFDVVDMDPAGAHKWVEVDRLGIRVNELSEAQKATRVQKDVKVIKTDGTVTFVDLDEDGKVPAAALEANCRVAYVYDNVVIPQHDLPMLKAEMKSISLIAHARRIAVNMYAA